MKSWPSNRSRGGVKAEFWWWVLVMLIALAPLAGVMFGQTEQSSIIGRVTDESGAVLPGVTVTTTSPALQVPQMMSVTDERGEYRLTPLPIGTFAVTYVLAGFQTIKQENVRLTAGFVAKIDEVMKLGAVSETITVSGQPAIVDVTSTGTSTQLTRETLELVPSTRNGLISVLAQVPGARGTIDVGGSNFATAPSFTAYGQIGQQWDTLEGVMTRSPTANTGTSTGQFWDYSTFEETKVTGIGKDVEASSAGLQINAIVKSGGNDFHGGGFYSATNHSFQSGNVDANLKNQGIVGSANLNARWDVSGDLGGRIVRNKLWFYGSARTRRDDVDVLNVIKPDGSPGNATNRQTFYTGKVSYQLTPGNRLVGFYQTAKGTSTGGNMDRFTGWTSRRNGQSEAPTKKIEWQGVRGNAIATLQYGDWAWDSSYNSTGSGPATYDQVTLMYGGDNIKSQNLFSHKRRHTSGKLAWYRPTDSWGNHQVRTGFDFLSTREVTGANVRPSGDYQLVFANGVPFQFVTLNDPTFPIMRGDLLAVIVADNWTIARRLTLNLGARISHEHDFSPAQCREPGMFAAAACYPAIDSFKIWNGTAPRLTAAFDVTGNGKTVIKGGWDRFDYDRSQLEVAAASPVATNSVFYRWSDPNGNRLYDPGEVNLDINGADYLSTGGLIGQNLTALSIADPNGIQPKQHQFYLTFERELAGGVAVRVTGAYTRAINVTRTVYLDRPYSVFNIPITRPDPGPDGVAGNADDPGTSLTYYDYPAAYAGAQFDRNTLTSPAGEPDRTFKTIELAATRRLSRGWQFMASYSATKKNIPVPTDWADKTPNLEINAADRTWDWQGRASMSYAFPLGLNGSAAFENRSGDAAARSVRLTGGRQIPNLVVNAEPIGSLRLPSINLLNLRVEKTFRLFNRQKLSARLNAYNALNANTMTAWTTRSGPTYLAPSTILPPRILELGATYAF